MGIEEVEARRAARKASVAADRDAQKLLDLEAMDALEEQHGPGKVVMLETAYHTAGLATCFIARAPSEPEYRRFRDMIRRDKHALGRAADMLAAVCVVYPDAEIRKRMLAEYPGLEDSVTAAVIGLVEGTAADQGKG